MKTAKELLQFIQDATYVCTHCGEVIYPIIKGVDVENENLDICISSSCVKGGLGNKIIKENICDDCVKKLTLLA